MLRSNLKIILTTFTLLLIILGTSWVLFNPNFFRIHDYIHAARVIEMTRALQDGHIIPRWSQNFGYGYGMPLFEFYAPLPYFFGAILLMLGLPMILVLKSLFLVANVATAFASYRLGKSLFGTIGGWIVAASITLAPYRALNLYVRGAVSEAWGIMAIPWILYGLVQIYKQEKNGPYITIVGLVVLFLSHNLTTLITAPTIGIFILMLLGLLYIYRHKREAYLSLIKTILISVVMALGLAAFYLIPMSLEKDFTKVESAVINSYFDYHLHFLYLRQFVTDTWGYGGSSWGPDDDISFYVGTATIIFSTLSLIYLLIHLAKQLKNRSKKISRPVVMGASISLALALTILMTTEKTLFIWDAISVLHFIQFPWRWLSTIIVWLGLFSALSIYGIKHTSHRVVFGLTFVLIALAFNAQYFRPEKYLEKFEDYYYTDPAKIRKNMSGILYDYMPKAVPLDLPRPTSLTNCEEAQVFNQECEGATIMVNRVHEKLFRTNFTDNQTVQIAVADFPGWQVELDGQGHSYTNTETGLIQVEVPEGEHTIGLIFNGSLVRNIADAISFISLCFALYFLFKEYGRLEKHNTHDRASRN